MTPQAQVKSLIIVFALGNFMLGFSSYSLLARILEWFRKERYNYMDNEKIILSKKEVRRRILSCIQEFNAASDDAAQEKAMVMLMSLVNYSWKEQRLYYKINQVLDSSGKDKLKLVATLPVERRVDTLSEQNRKELENESDNQNN